MFNNIKGFFKEMFNKNKQINKRPKIINNKNMSTIIIPGQYQLKTSIGAEKPEIIRIMGADINHSDNWLTQDKKSIPSYIIENDYMRLDMIPNLEYVKKSINSNIFSDFKPIELDNIEIPIQNNNIETNSPSPPLPRE